MILYCSQPELIVAGSYGTGTGFGKYLFGGTESFRLLMTDPVDLVHFCRIITRQRAPSGTHLTIYPLCVGPTGLDLTSLPAFSFFLCVAAKRLEERTRVLPPLRWGNHQISPADRALTGRSTSDLSLLFCLFLSFPSLSLRSPDLFGKARCERVRDCVRVYGGKWQRSAMPLLGLPSSLGL